MKTGAIQDQLAERIAAIERKHATIGTQKRVFLPRPSGENGRMKAGGEHSSPLSITPTGPPLIDSANADSPISFPQPQSISRHLLPLGLHEIDEAISGGLRPGVHEWYAGNAKIQCSRIEEQGAKGSLNNRQSTFANRHSISLCLLVHLAWRVLEANPSRRVIWVGKNCFPYPAVLTRDTGRDIRLLRRSLFVCADSPADRVWVTDLSIRCGLAGAVIADGTGLDMAATRRLQLSARSHGRFVFLARPPQDLDKLSAATTRWMVVPGGMARRSAATPAPAIRGLGHPTHENPNPQWSLELLRCKGMQPSTSRCVWLVEWNRAANVIGVRTPLCDCTNNQARRHEGTEARRARV